jgi:hypothetical protein
MHFRLVAPGRARRLLITIRVIPVLYFVPSGSIGCNPNCEHDALPAAEGRLRRSAYSFRDSGISHRVERQTLQRHPVTVGRIVSLDCS